jgi:hypothetical protein
MVMLFNENWSGSCSLSDNSLCSQWSCGSYQVFLDDHGGLVDLSLYDSLIRLLLPDYGCHSLGNYGGTLAFLMHHLLVRFMNDGFVHLMNDLLMPLVNDRLMNLADLLLIDDGLMHLVDDRLMVLVNDILVVLMNHILVMLVDHITMRFLNNRCIRLSDDSGCNSVRFNDGLLSCPIENSWLVVADHRSTQLSALNNRSLNSPKSFIIKGFITAGTTLVLATV